MTIICWITCPMWFAGMLRRNTDSPTYKLMMSQLALNNDRSSEIAATLVLISTEASTPPALFSLKPCRPCVSGSIKATASGEHAIPEASRRDIIPSSSHLGFPSNEMRKTTSQRSFEEFVQVKAPLPRTSQRIYRTSLHENNKVPATVSVILKCCNTNQSAQRCSIHNTSQRYMNILAVSALEVQSSLRGHSFCESILHQAPISKMLQLYVWRVATQVSESRAIDAGRLSMSRSTFENFSVPLSRTAKALTRCLDGVTLRGSLIRFLASNAPGGFPAASSI